MPCDYKKYDPAWKQIRARILERAEHRCEQCGLPNYAVGYRGPDGTFWIEDGERYIPDEIVEGGLKKIVLTISHTNHDVTDNRDENLRALCQRCHNIHDIDYRKANRAATRRRKNPQTLCLQFD